MGIAKFWQLLEEAEEGTLTSLTDCSGQSWAVDLSAWIVHGHTAGMASKNVSGTYTMIRTVFYRALALLKHGIRPLIVLDSETAPEVKVQTLQERCERTYGHSKTTGLDRTGVQATNKMCLQVLEALGLQVITSSGEAEKTCALLNSQGIVDACLCEDSDVFLYGAKKVYRKLDLKEETVEEHTLHGIEEKLQLSRKDLVVMALLSGCDYGDGVKSIGQKKVLDLIHSIKKYSDDVLTRVCGWRDNEDLVSQEELRQRLISTKKTAHCTVCQHPGSKKLHEEGGCGMCGSTEACKDDDSVSCTCDYHELQRNTAPYTVELVVRDKAIKNQEFPNMKLIEEFTDDSETFSITSVEVTLPHWHYLAHEMHLSQEDLMRKMIPVLVFMHLHGTLHLPDVQPISIVRQCKRKFVACYQVLWKRFAFDKWTPQPSDNVEMTPLTKQQDSDNPYIVDLPCDFFAEKYPQLVKSYTLNSSGKRKKGKRPQVDNSERIMTDFCQVKKRLFEEDKIEGDKNEDNKDEDDKNKDVNATLAMPLNRASLCEHCLASCGVDWEIHMSIPS